MLWSHYVVCTFYQWHTSLCGYRNSFWVVAIDAPESCKSFAVTLWVMSLLHHCAPLLKLYKPSMLLPKHWLQLLPPPGTLRSPLLLVSLSNNLSYDSKGQCTPLNCNLAYRVFHETLPQEERNTGGASVRACKLSEEWEKQHTLEIQSSVSTLLYCVSLAWPLLLSPSFLNCKKEGIILNFEAYQEDYAVCMASDIYWDSVESSETMWCKRSLGSSVK